MGEKPEEKHRVQRDREGRDGDCECKERVERESERE